jgi:hypothetical protein
MPSASRQMMYPGSHNLPVSGYEPQPGDVRLKRDQVFIDLDESGLVFDAGQPTVVSLILKGYLPDPCHLLRVVILPWTHAHEISLEAYSLFDPHKACITVIKEYSAVIPLGVLISGSYKVFVNHQLIKQFDI